MSVQNSKRCCFYTYEIFQNKCPGLATKSGRFIQKKCMYCGDFNGITGREGGRKK